MPVPALVDEAVFAAARAQLVENRQRKRDGLRGPRWLLQGLTVCRQCGYTYYGKALPRSRADPSKCGYRQYRCLGTDGYRFGGTAPCSNRTVRAEHLEQAVWERVCALLQNPSRVADEYRRRVRQAGEGAVKSDELVQLERQRAALQRGIGRLIDSYAAGVIDRSEFEPRITGLKARVAQLQEQQRAAADVANAERELTLVIGQLEDFASKVRHSLESLDWLSIREIIRTLVRRIEIDGDQVEVIFRVPPPVGSGGPSWPGPASGEPPVRQDCTVDRGAVLRLAQPQSSARQGLRDYHRVRDSLPLRRLSHAPHQAHCSLHMSSKSNS